MNVYVMLLIDESGRKARLVQELGVCAANEEAALRFAQREFPCARRASCEHVAFDLFDRDGNDLDFVMLATEYEVVE